MNYQYVFSFSGSTPVYPNNYCSGYNTPGEEGALIFTPPVTGNYIFNIQSQSALVLSYKVNDTTCTNANLINCYYLNAYQIYNLSIGPLTAGVPYKFLFDLISTNSICDPVLLEYCEFDLKITCGNVPSFSFSHLEPTKFDVSWNCSGCGTIKYIEYGPEGFIPGTGASPGVNGTLISNVTSPTTISGLTPYTRYDVYMRSACGTSFSANLGIENVRTAPDCATAPTVVTDSLYRRVPTGLLENANGAWASTACSGILRNGHELLSRFTPQQNGNYTMTIFSTSFSISSTPISIYTKPANSTCDEFNWNCAGSNTLTGINSNPINISLGSLNAGTTYLVLIDLEPNIFPSYAVAFKISNSTNCASPLIDNIIPPFNLTSISLKGTCVSCTGTTYVEYGLAGFTPGTGSSPGVGGTLITNPVFPLTINGLTPSTTYHIYSRENCGSGLGFSTNSIKTEISLACNYAPTINVSGYFVCPGTPVTVSAIGGDAGPGGSMKIYSGSCGGTLVGTGTSVVVTPLQTTTYYVRAESPCGNSGCNMTTVNVTPSATITPTGSTTFCAGGSVTLNANTGSGLTYQWKKYGNPIAGATLPTYTATTAGVYKVTVTNNTGCSATSSNLTVTVNALPTAAITAGGSTAICPGSSVNLNANTGAGLTYQWRKYSNDIAGATNSTYAVTSAGQYKVRVTNANGCSKNSNTITVTTL
ncbi:MAG TPA: hypothetical protein PKD91_09365, partial [Bacteroidia bacterium]|nr:hypothetical protein [Bacteroidia bacterium]